MSETPLSQIDIERSADPIAEHDNFVLGQEDAINPSLWSSEELTADAMRMASPGFGHGVEAQRPAKIERIPEHEMITRINAYGTHIKLTRNNYGLAA